MGLKITLEQFLNLHDDEKSEIYVFILIEDGLKPIKYTFDTTWHRNFKDEIVYKENKNKNVKNFTITLIDKYPSLIINLE